MRSNFMAVSYARFSECGVPFHRDSDSPESHIPAKLFHKPQDTPGTTSASILVVLLAIQMSLFSPATRWAFLPEVWLTRAISIHRIPFSTFFIVEDERYGNTSTIWPLWIVAVFSKTCRTREREWTKHLLHATYPQSLVGAAGSLRHAPYSANPARLYSKFKSCGLDMRVFTVSNNFGRQGLIRKLPLKCP
jgi:hypothetical protein